MNVAIEIENRKRIRQQYGALFDTLSSILYQADPIGINFKTNTGEYDPEVGTIIPRLAEARDECDIRRIVHEELCKWFDGEDVGPLENYTGIAARFWGEWRKHRDFCPTTAR